MSDATQEYVHKSWELVDVILNAILFNLIALVLIVIDFKTDYLIIGFVSVMIVLMVRILVVYFPILSFPNCRFKPKGSQNHCLWRRFERRLIHCFGSFLTGRRGEKHSAGGTYFCVLFSILVQFND